MGFGGLVPASVIKLIAGQQRGQVRPVDDNVAPDDDAPASEIQQYSGPPAQPQLDASNLAGPVPTNLSGPADSGQKFAPPVIPPASNVSGFNFTPDSMGVPTNIPGQQSRPTGLDNPAIPQTPNNRLNNGTPQPTRQDDKYAQMGRGASARAAFTQGFQHNDIVGGALDALFGAIDKDYGRQIQYNQDSQRWFNTKDAQLKTEEMDPVLRSRIAVGQQEAEIPGRVKQYELEQNLANQNRINIENLRSTGRIAAIKEKNAGLMANLQQKDQDKVNFEGDRYATQIMLAQPEISLKEAKQLGNARALQDHQDQSDYKQSRTDMNDSRAAELDAVTKNLPQKFKDAHSRVDALIQNAQTNAGRLKLQQGNADQRAENERQLRQGAALQSEVNTLENDHKAQYAIVNNPYNQTPDKKPLVDAANKRIQEINSRLDEINSQRLDTAGAPGKGQKATKPGAGGLTPEQNRDYQSRKAKYPNLTPQQYLDIISKIGK